jgi:predicted AAA+ superfamily ATPase
VGYFPFYDGNEEQYYSRIENVIDFVVELELTQFCGVEPANTRKVKALIQYLADSVPFEFNIAKLSARLELNKHTVLGYINSLGRAELLQLLYSDSKTITRLQKPDKIYLHDPNLFYALGYGEKIGTIRECFLVNQLSVNHIVEYGKTQGDFVVDGEITIEVGGRDKSFDQVAGIPNSYIMADQMAFPIGKKLPLWMAGLVY